MIRKRHVIANWKMNGSISHIDTYFSGLVSSKTNDAQAVICPPFVYLSQAKQHLTKQSHFALGAQDVSENESGAYTGQISAQMLVEQGCRYVIVGHSERRQGCHESDADIANKFFAAKTAGLIPVLCVGETQEQRVANATEQVIVGQLKPILDRQADAFRDSLIAYEPIWAIGTGLTATPEQAQAVHYLLRRTVAEYDATVADVIPILYGGSVKPSNAQALFEMPDIDGALVGGASFQLTDFLAIYQAAG